MTSPAATHPRSPLGSHSPAISPRLEPTAKLTVVIGLLLGISWLLTACGPGSVVTIKTTDNAQAVVDAHPEGTVFRFEAGTHYNARILPKEGQAFTADSLGSAILDGGGVTDVAFRSRDSRASDTFAHNVVIENLVFTGYSPQDYWGVVDATSDDYERHGPQWQTPTRWAMRNLRFTSNPGSGDSSAITAGSESRISFVTIENHPGPGITGHGYNMTVEGSTINNTSPASQVYWHSGGIKLVVAHGASIINNTITGSAGPGVWIDVSSDEVTISGNDIRNNGLSGIYYEVSRNGVIENNTLYSNGYGETRGWMFPAGIVLSSSNETIVRNNQLTYNAGGITVIDQRTLRNDDRYLAPLFGELYDADGSVAQWRGENNVIEDNSVVGGGVHGVSAAAGESIGSTVYDSTVFQNNTYAGGTLTYRWGSGDNYAGNINRSQWDQLHPND